MSSVWVCWVWLSIKCHVWRLGWKMCFSAVIPRYLSYGVIVMGICDPKGIYWWNLVRFIYPQQTSLKSICSLRFLFLSLERWTVISKFTMSVIMSWKLSLQWRKGVAHSWYTFQRGTSGLSSRCPDLHIQQDGFFFLTLWHIKICLGTLAEARRQMWLKWDKCTNASTHTHSLADTCC